MRRLGLVLMFVLLAYVELRVTFFAVPHAIGAAATIALLAATSVLGAWLLKAQGRAAWRRLTDTVRAGRVPSNELVDGALIVFGSAFLITPGFVTDAIGLILLLPPTRSLVRNHTVRSLERRGLAALARRPGRRAPASDFDVEGSATEYDFDPGAGHGSSPRAGQLEG